MKRIGFASVLAGAWFVAACVTINIYFPAAQAQEAAEKIVEDILSGKAEEKPQEAPPGDDKQSSSQPAYLRLIDRTLALLVTPAHAKAPNFEVDTPEIRKLQASMKRRNAQLRPYYVNGAVGFTNEALVAIRDPSAVPLRERARLKQLVEAENQDRNSMYGAIARANGHPEWEPEVRRTFARTWVDQAGASWWYQNPRGEWLRK